nr:glycosyltransferase [uncultured Gemmiger sp.]
MASLSVCMIVRDEEPVIGRCLSAVAVFADEIIVLDTGSRDRTAEIARTYTDRVFSEPWQDDFAAARNASYRKARCDYVMWMDADDVVRPEQAQLLRRRMDALPDTVDGVLLPYAVHEPGRAEVFDSYLLRDRILRRSLHPVWENAVHEAISLDPDWQLEIWRDIPVYHDKLVVNEEGRNLRIFETQMARGWVLDNFSAGYYCRELFLAGQHEQAVRVFEKLVDSGAEDFIVYNALQYYISSMETLKRYRQLADTLLDYVQRWGETELVCCELGRCFLKEKDWNTAEHWYQRALAVKLDDTDLKIHCRAWNTVVPWVQLARISLKKRQPDQAQVYLDQAKRLAGNDKMVLLVQLMVERQKAGQAEQKAVYYKG